MLENNTKLPNNLYNIVKALGKPDKIVEVNLNSTYIKPNKYLAISCYDITNFVNLQKLKLSNFTKIPIIPKSVTSLTLYKCNNYIDLKDNPSLEHLTILDYSNKAVKLVGDFTNLKSLNVEGSQLDISEARNLNRDIIKTTKISVHINTQYNYLGFEEVHYYSDESNKQMVIT